MKSSDTAQSQLAGQLLVAMPAMADSRFARSVIYLCAHSTEGAMGIVVNHLINSMTIQDVIAQVGIETPCERNDIPVLSGGPVESSRGFLLHTSDLANETTLIIDDSYALTASVEGLRAIVGSAGPSHCLFALGYAGWGPGQLDAEIQANAWLVAPASSDIVFDGEPDTKWLRALNSIGVDPSSLSTVAGHA